MLPLVYMYKRLASLLSHKWDQLYCKTMNGLASWQPDFLTSELFHHVYISRGLDLHVVMPNKYSFQWT